MRDVALFLSVIMAVGGITLAVMRWGRTRNFGAVDGDRDAEFAAMMGGTFAISGFGSAGFLLGLLIWSPLFFLEGPAGYVYIGAIVSGVAMALRHWRPSIRRVVDKLSGPTAAD